VNTGPPEPTIQDVVWKLTAPAELTNTVTGVQNDLLFDEPCVYVQTTKSSYVPLGRCAAGIILGSSDDAGAVEPPEKIPATFVLTVASMQVRRAKPLVLEQNEDYDADRVKNVTDNCPLLPNEDQADTNEDGIGDVCSVRTVSGTFVADNDGDKVADASDNCVWYANPGQEDTMGIAEEYGVPDGIGDACVEQVAFVQGTIPTFDFSNLEVSLATGGLALLTVDFDGSVTLTDLDWKEQTFDLVTDGVRACATPSTLSQALDGCPAKGQTDP